MQVQMETTKSPFFTVRCGFLGSSTISLVTVSCREPDDAEETTLTVLHPELGTHQWHPALQAHWETRTSISLTLEGSEKSPSPNTTFCCKFTSFPEGSQEACGNLLLGTNQGGADEEQGPGRAGRNSEHRPLIWYVSLCAQGSLPLLQLLFCGLTLPGYWGSQGSSSLAVSIFSTCCIVRGTGETQPQPGPV